MELKDTSIATVYRVKFYPPRIHIMELKGVGEPYWLTLLEIGIHTMELKASTVNISGCLNVESMNPYNGIERRVKNCVENGSSLRGIHTMELKVGLLLRLEQSKRPPIGCCRSSSAENFIA